MKKVLILLLSTFLLTSCSTSYTKSGVSSGWLITSWNDTISGDVDSSIKTTKMGKACTTNILGAVAIGDSSIKEAKSDGNITKVSYTDTTYNSFLLGIYQRGCTVVRGE